MPEERPSSRSAEENSGSKNKSKTAQPVAEQTEDKTKEVVISDEAKIWQDNQNLHWSDVSIKAGKATIVDLEDQIMTKLNGSSEKRSSHGTSFATPHPKTPNDD